MGKKKKGECQWNSWLTVQGEVEKLTSLSDIKTGQTRRGGKKSGKKKIAITGRGKKKSRVRVGYKSTKSQKKQKQSHGPLKKEANLFIGIRELGGTGKNTRRSR